MRRTVATVFAVASLTAAACDDEEKKAPPPDVGERLPPGKARAGRVVRPDQLIGGASAQGKVGDWKIYNSRVRFLIEDGGPSDGYNTWGGMPIAADLVRAPGEADQSLFGEMFFGVGVRPPRIETVELVNDGQNGAPAVLRVSGPDTALPIVESFIPTISPPINATYTIEYTLAPDDDALQIAVQIQASAEQGVAATFYAGFLMGDGLRSFFPGEGFNTQMQVLPTPYYAAVGKDVTYALKNKSSQFTRFFTYQEMIIGSYEFVQLGPGDTGSYYYLLAVGPGGDVGSAIERFARDSGQALVALSGTVSDGAAPVAGARVHVEREDGGDYDDEAILATGADGTFSARLPAALYRISAAADGRLPSGSSVIADLRAGPASGLAVTVTSSGTLSMSATEGGHPVPAKFTVLPMSPTPELPASWGEGRYKFGADKIEFSASGSSTVQVAPGDYRVTASRGFEYDRVQEVVTVAAGGTATFAAELHRVVDTTGWVSGDFHIHAQKSPDSNDMFEHKVSAFAAEGLEVPCATDHDFIADYRPIAVALGVDKFMHTMIGVETSTNFGHINAYPLQQLRGQPNMGAVNWFYKFFPQIFPEMRENPAQPLLQVNHPFSQSGGMWYTVDLDPATGLPRTGAGHPNWSEEFDAAEILNGTNISVMEEKIMPAWFALLNRGKRVTGMGNSDSHTARSSQVGRPRTYMAVANDDPAVVTDSDVRGAIAGMAVTVSSGPFVTATIGGQGSGKVVTQAGEVTVHVKIQLPAWAGPLDTIELVANGAVVATVGASDGRWHQDQTVRFEGDIAHTPARDTWYLVRVYGPGGDPMGPVASGRTFAFTNPIYVDRDGNGFAPSL